eukprot:5190815-Ditylum_brightwellii.AAC.1
MAEGGVLFHAYKATAYFCNVKGKHHNVDIDNLFNSLRFSIVVWSQCPKVSCMKLVEECLHVSYKKNLVAKWQSSMSDNYNQEMKDDDIADQL